MTEKKYYYKVDLEVARHKSKYVFGFIDISHIPYSKLYELFKDQITDERFLFEKYNYFITPELYKQHKEYLDKNIPFSFDFKLFEYSVGFGSVEVDKYQKDYHEELPPLFDMK
jgi:hypothetical protein